MVVPLPILTLGLWMTEYLFPVVFTSTVNVSFFGREVIGGTEEDDEKGEGNHIRNYVDAYSRSKNPFFKFIYSL